MCEILQNRIAIISSFYINYSLILGDTDKMFKFFLEYSAGMIQFAQPLYAIKLLSSIVEKSKAAETDKRVNGNAEDSMDQGIILVLMGLRNFTKYFAENTLL